LKAALDRDWDQQREKDEALTLVLQVLQTVQTWLQTLMDLEDGAAAHDAFSIAQQVQEQDVQVDEKGKASLIKGVAKDRRISVEDSEMRHGRKSRSVLVNGYKRHVLHDLDTNLIRAVGITPANVPEACVTEAISEDLKRQEVSLNPRIAQRDCCRAQSDLKSESCSKPDAQPARDGRNRRTERKQGGREQGLRNSQEKRL
jgi:hypothetical protein